MADSGRLDPADEGWRQVPALGSPQDREALIAALGKSRVTSVAAAEGGLARAGLNRGGLTLHPIATQKTAPTNESCAESCDSNTCESAGSVYNRNKVLTSSIMKFVLRTSVFTSFLPIGLSLMALPATAAEPRFNFEQIGFYSSSNDGSQVPSIGQFSDIRPGDWAYQALNNLVTRYGCVAGYPDGR